jgi:nicotinate dehydrogenase subunit B
MKKTRKYKSESSGPDERYGLQRRDFFKLLGGGILILFRPWNDLKMTTIQAQVERTLPKDFNAFLHIAEDGTVSCFTGKVELGQGNLTALAQLIADELDVKYDRIKMVMGDTDLCPWDDGTWGSTSIRSFGPALRAASAEAKAVLLQLGSERLGVPVSQLEIIDSIISDKTNKKKKVTYAELTKGKKIERHLKDKPVLKDSTKFKIIGNPYMRQDARLKVTGQGKYAGDFKFPGMWHARILRPPTYGAKLISADVTEAEKIKGIKVVRDGDLIAVLHEVRDKADEAIVKVKAKYSPDEMKVDDKTIFAHYLKSATKGNEVRKKGDIAVGSQLSETIIESEFNDSYVAHAPIEPHAAVAKTEGDKITVWVSTQTPFPAQESVASALKVPLDKVRVIVPFVGGGFGGKAAHEQAVEAARLAKLTGKPVMVDWTRQEEFFYDTLRSAAVIKITSGFNKEGKITLWDYKVYCAGSRGSEITYDVPHFKITDYDQREGEPDIHPFATGPWRAPGNSDNTFAREFQICLMASRAGLDPLEFRIKNLKDQKMITVLKAVADKFGYTPGKGPSGRGYGIACGTDVGTWVALMAEVKVDKNTGHVQVVRVTCVQDMGLCVNPQGSTLQMEGCITMGLGYALTEEVQFEGGNMHSQNFDTYKIPRFSWVPKIETEILDRKDQPMRGGGEPAIIGMGGAIASGIFDATGAIMYNMPMTPERVLAALKKV